MQAVARSFVLGFISLFDLTGAIYASQTRPLLRRSDEDAIRSDWYAVGADLYHAFSVAKGEEAKASPTP